MGSQTLELEIASATAPNKQAISSIIVVVDIVPTAPAPATPEKKSFSPVVVVVDPVPSLDASTTPNREAILAINIFDTAPKIQAPITPIREVIPAIHDVGSVSTTVTPFTPAIEVASPTDVFGTLPTAREPERHVSDGVAGMAEITKINTVNNEPLVRPVTYNSQPPQAQELSVQKVTEASPVHDDNARINEAPQNGSGRESTATDTALEAQDTATALQDGASIIHNDDLLADMDVDMAQDDGEIDHLAKYLAKDEETSAAAAVACQMTEDDQMEMQAAFDVYFAELDAGTVASSTEDMEPFAVAALAGKVDDADQMEMEITLEQHPAAIQDSSALSKTDETTQHNLDTDMMVDVPHQAVQELGSRILSTAERAVPHGLDPGMMDGMIHGAAGEHNSPDPLTTEGVSLRHFELDDVMHDATGEHYAAAPSTTAQEIDMMDDVVHQAAEKHDTEMRDAPENKHKISARDKFDIEMRDSPKKRHGVTSRGAIPNPVVNNPGHALPPRMMAPQFGQGRSAAQRRVNSPIVQPIFVSDNAPAPALAPLNRQARSAAQVSVISTSAQPLRSRSNAFISESPYLNGPISQQDLVTRAPDTSNQQRDSHNGGRTPKFPTSYVGPPLQQARPSAQQGPSRPPAAMAAYEEEPCDPWADQKVKVNKNKNRGRKKAEDEAKTLANIIARYSLPPPPELHGTKRKLYIDHFGPDAYRERVDGNGGEYHIHLVYCCC